MHERTLHLSRACPLRRSADQSNKSLSLFRRNQNFSGTGYGNSLNVFRFSLRHQIEIADLIDLIAEKFHSHGCVQMRRENIDDTAADAELTLTVHEIGANVARAYEKFRKFVHLHAISDRKRSRRTAKHISRNRKRKRRRRRCDHDVELFVQHIRQNGNTLMLQLMGRYHIIKNGITIRIDSRS